MNELLLHELKSFSLTRLNEIYKTIAIKHEIDYNHDTFSSVPDACTALLRVIASTNERLIMVLCPNYIKRGEAANRFPLYENGLLLSDFIRRCSANGYSIADARRDVRYDRKHGLIKVV